MTKPTLLEFPCHFPIKIVGSNSQTFIDAIRALVFEHFPTFTEDKFSQKESAQSNYVAITVVVLAENQQILDAFYTKVSSHPEVKMVL